jgi:arsenate reductase (glutaredoxin)
MTKIYGIKNCDTVKKALQWLDSNGISYEFHDYKKHGVDEKKLREFIKKFGWQKVLNSKGTTFRKLSDAQKPTTEAQAITLMLQQPSIIKRPIFDNGSLQLLGFDVAEYEAAKISHE